MKRKKVSKKWKEDKGSLSEFSGVKNMKNKEKIQYEQCIVFEDALADYIISGFKDITIKEI